MKLCETDCCHPMRPAEITNNTQRLKHKGGGKPEEAS